VENRNDKVNTNRRNRAESGGLETANLGDIREAVTADRKNTLLSHQPRTVAPSQLTTSANAKSIGTRHPSSPLRSSGPLKIRETDGEYESGPSFSAVVQRTFGTSDGHLSAELLRQVTRALPNAEPLDPHGNHALATLHGIGPRDPLEGLLAVQMVAVHNLEMEFFRRAALKEQPDTGVDLNLNRATKLLRAFVTLNEALDRHRGKGEQKMNVEHVHIHDGAQGIVGPVSHPGSLNASEEDHEKSN
jgi:hypothetical protein